MRSTNNANHSQSNSVAYHSELGKRVEKPSSSSGDTNTAKSDGTNLDLGSETYRAYSSGLQDKSPDGSRHIINASSRYRSDGSFAEQAAEEIEGTSNYSDATQQRAEKYATEPVETQKQYEAELQVDNPREVRTARIQQINDALERPSIMNPDVSIGREDTAKELGHLVDGTKPKSDNYVLAKVRKKGIEFAADPRTVEQAVHTGDGMGFEAQSAVVVSETRRHDPKTADKLAALSARFASGIERNAGTAQQIADKALEMEDADKEFEDRQMNKMLPKGFQNFE